MHLAEGDYLIGMEVVEKDGLILSIAENGYGKRTRLENYRLTARGGKGVINMKTTHKTGKVIDILSVKEDSDLMIVSQNWQDHPHRIFHHPPGRPFHARRPAGDARGRRQSGRRFCDPRYRKRQWQRGRIVGAGHARPDYYGRTRNSSTPASCSKSRSGSSPICGAWAA